jgi:hypothetical protein
LPPPIRPACPGDLYAFWKIRSPLALPCAEFGYSAISPPAGTANRPSTRARTNRGCPMCMMSGSVTSRADRPSTKGRACAQGGPAPEAFANWRYRRVTRERPRPGPLARPLFSVRVSKRSRGFRKRMRPAPLARPRKVADALSPLTALLPRSLTSSVIAACPGATATLAAGPPPRSCRCPIAAHAPTSPCPPPSIIAACPGATATRRVAPPPRRVRPRTAAGTALHAPLSHAPIIKHYRSMFGSARDPARCAAPAESQAA